MHLCSLNCSKPETSRAHDKVSLYLSFIFNVLYLTNGFIKYIQKKSKNTIGKNIFND